MKLEAYLQQNNISLYKYYMPYYVFFTYKGKSFHAIEICGNIQVMYTDPELIDISPTDVMNNAKPVSFKMNDMEINVDTMEEFNNKVENYLKIKILQ